MKKFKIWTILILLMGFGTVYSQQATGGQQKNDHDQKTGQADRSTLSPNPAPGEQTEVQNLGNSNGDQQLLPDAAEIADPESSPNKPTSPATLTTEGPGAMETTKVENIGPRPSDPNGIRPETK